MMLDSVVVPFCRKQAGNAEGSVAFYLCVCSVLLLQRSEATKASSLLSGMEMKLEAVVALRFLWEQIRDARA